MNYSNTETIKCMLNIAEHTKQEKVKTRMAAIGD